MTIPGSSRIVFIILLDDDIVLGAEACLYRAWWRHQMETFSTLLALCAGNRDAGDFKRHHAHYDTIVIGNQSETPI